MSTKLYRVHSIEGGVRITWVALVGRGRLGSLPGATPLLWRVKRGGRGDLPATKRR